MASDRGLGLVAGSRAAWEEALWVCDSFHAFHDLFHVLHQWERKAYAALGKAEDAAQKFAQATSAANLDTRLQPYEHASQACEQALAIDDQLALLLSLLRATFQGCSPQGRLRTVEGGRSALTLLLHRIEAMDCASITKVLQPLTSHLADI
jgi:hypothetical protein